MLSPQPPEYVDSFWKILEEAHELSLPWVCDALDFNSVNGNLTLNDEDFGDAFQGLTDLNLD